MDGERKRKEEKQGGKELEAGEECSKFFRGGGGVIQHLSITPENELLYLQDKE